MEPGIKPVATSSDYPKRTTVVVIGGGIIGLATALNLAEHGVPVVVLEKGRLAAEQSGRNLGWVRKLNRSAKDLPLAQAAERLWEKMSERTGMAVGYRKAGMTFLAASEKELQCYQNWLDGVKDLLPSARILSPTEAADLIPGAKKRWLGALFDATDGYAEPSLAATAIATQAQKQGAIIVENCAARTLSLSAGRVSGVVTEYGEIQCDQVALAAGLWSRRFLGNLGISLPNLPMAGAAVRIAPLEGGFSDLAIAGANFSCRKRIDGGYTLMHRAALGAPLTFDHVRVGMKYLPALRANWSIMRFYLGRHWLDEMRLARRWKAEDVSPFELNRAMSPPVNNDLAQETVANLAAVWPQFEKAEIRSVWSGLMDMTPDSEPVIDKVDKIPGLTLSAGYSGHGFGAAPAAGQLTAELIMNEAPVVDPATYRLDRF